ncbi:MAG: 2Fe-2S iron-sulfur cluster binding domain-containing protein [Oligoflexales bacterium]|nr:2Fe-2S iron-sulfur cluster binding domain-containing protein [Oligoflexales bacterium]
MSQIRVKFLPEQKVLETDESLKILLAAKRLKLNIRFGCAACRCGTCAVLVNCNSEQLSPIQNDERELLNKMRLKTDGSIRLACQAKVLSGDIEVDLAFQNSYSPDDGVIE